MESLLSVLIFIIILSAVIALRLRIGGTFEIRNSEIVIAFIPVAIWLVLTGKIERFGFGDFVIVSAFREASGAAIKKQVLPVIKISMSPKGSDQELDLLIENKTEALTFKLGNPYYTEDLIKKYLNRLNEHSFFKYVIINTSQGGFYGMLDSRELYGYINSTSGSGHNFASHLKNENKLALSSIPGLIPAEKAITRDIDRKAALELMEDRKVSIIPVVDKKGKFVGIAERSILTASLIIDVVNKFEGNKRKKQSSCPPDNKQKNSAKSGDQ